MVIKDRRVFMYCEKCGCNAQGDSMFCPNCGNIMGQASNGMNQQGYGMNQQGNGVGQQGYVGMYGAQATAPVAKKKSKGPVIVLTILLILSVLVCGGCVAYILFGMTGSGSSAMVFTEDEMEDFAEDGFIIVSTGVLVQYIGDDTDVVIPDGVVHIEASAFAYTYGLESIEIPDTVTSIGTYAFWGNYYLEEVEIPEGVVSIGAQAFAYSGVVEVSIPESVEYIGDGAFEECESLKNIVVAEDSYAQEYCEDNMNYVFD